MSTEATALKSLETFARKKNGSYLVLLNDTVDKPAHLSELRKRLGKDETVTYDDWDNTFLHGYAIQLNTDDNNPTLQHLLAHPDVCV
jgi:hypothetical protein